MASLYLLIPIAIIFVTIAIALFFWAVEHSQFDDPDGAAHSILFDEPALKPGGGKQTSRNHKKNMHKKNVHKRVSVKYDP